MEKLITLLLFSLFAFSPISAQSAKEVLDKTAAAVSNKSGVTASFTLKGGQMSDNGTISIKGRMFQVTTPDAIIWFDGKTQWTYMKKNDEVNIANPTEAEIQAINPYNFIYMYKKGYSYTMEKKGGNYEVHLQQTQRKGLREMYIVINAKTYIPSQIRIHHKKGWNTIDIRDFKKANLSDSMFRFNSKDFPNAEVIDLR